MNRPLVSRHQLSSSSKSGRSPSSCPAGWPGWAGGGGWPSCCCGCAGAAGWVGRPCPAARARSPIVISLICCAARSVTSASTCSSSGAGWGAGMGACWIKSGSTCTARKRPDQTCQRGPVAAGWGVMEAAGLTSYGCRMARMRCVLAAVIGQLPHCTSGGEFSQRSRSWLRREGHGSQHHTSSRRSIRAPYCSSALATSAASQDAATWSAVRCDCRQHGCEWPRWLQRCPSQCQPHRVDGIDLCAVLEQELGQIWSVHCRSEMQRRSVCLPKRTLKSQVGPRSQDAGVRLGLGGQGR